MRLKNGWSAVITLVLLVPAFSQAHVTIAPRESMQGATVRYTVRIPTEGEIATVGAELDVPEGVIVETFQTPVGWTYEVSQAEDRVVAIRWRVDVKPGEFIEVGFVARNPRQGAEIVWVLRQLFADGTVRDWTNGPNGVRPTAVTRLAPRAQQ